MIVEDGSRRTEIARITDLHKHFKSWKSQREEDVRTGNEIGQKIANGRIAELRKQLSRI